MAILTTCSRCGRRCINGRVITADDDLRGAQDADSPLLSWYCPDCFAILAATTKKKLAERKPAR